MGAGCVPSTLPPLLPARTSPPLDPAPQLERSPLLHLGFQALDAFQVGAALPLLVVGSACGKLEGRGGACRRARAGRQVPHRPSSPLPPSPRAPDRQASHGGRLPEPGSEAEAAEVVAEARKINEAAADKVGVVGMWGAGLGSSWAGTWARQALGRGPSWTLRLLGCVPACLLALGRGRHSRERRAAPAAHPTSPLCCGTDGIPHAPSGIPPGGAG